VSFANLPQQFQLRLQKLNWNKTLWIYSQRKAKKQQFCHRNTRKTGEQKTRLKRIIRAAWSL
jgi:hypothetical protein